MHLPTPASAHRRQVHSGALGCTRHHRTTRWNWRAHRSDNKALIAEAEAFLILKYSCNDRLAAVVSSDVVRKSSALRKVMQHAYSGSSLQFRALKATIPPEA